MYNDVRHCHSVRMFVEVLIILRSIVEERIFMMSITHCLVICTTPMRVCMTTREVKSKGSRHIQPNSLVSKLRGRNLEYRALSSTLSIVYTEIDCNLSSA